MGSSEISELEALREAKLREEALEEGKVRTFGFDLQPLVGENWHDQVQDVSNEDYQGSLTESGPDRHISSIQFKDGKKVAILSAKVMSGNPFEHMEQIGGGDLRNTESWLYIFHPDKQIATIVSPDGNRQEIKCTEQIFDNEVEKLRRVYRDEGRAITSFKSPPPIPKKERKG